MGVENAADPTPPKKKLKQAQLPFCIVTSKANKRKLSDDSENADDEVPVKVLCQQASTPPKNVLTEKDNVEVRDESKTSEITEESLKESIDLNVTATSDAQNSACDQSLDCSLVLSMSSCESDRDEAAKCESSDGKHEKRVDDGEKTPKQKLKSERRAERERLKKEKELERSRQKEEKLRIKQEKENARKKEKEDKEQKRLAEIRAKDEEKRKKEEAKEEARRQKELDKKRKEEAKEEEKKKKEEEKLALERKENLAKEAFSKFFKRAKTVEEPEKSQAENSQKFMPFPVKGDMKLAAVKRTELSLEAKDKLTSFLVVPSDGDSALYLSELKSGARIPGKSEATWPSSDEVHDVIIIESVKDENEKPETVDLPKKKQSFRAKLFQFQENRRPPYWGTWRKTSETVSARRPFGKEKILDYELDSDSEWEDEGEGEDLDKENESDAEKESDDENVGENGYLIDNSVFVPHGYLSDEEAEDEENCDPESQKLRMAALKREFDEEMKQFANRLQPKVLGCVWISNETTEVSKGSLYQVLMNHRCIWNEEISDLTGPVVEDTPPTPQSGKIKFPESLLEPLVKMVHGSQLSHIALVKEFMASLEKEEGGAIASKRAVSLKIKDIAMKTSSANGPAWHVSADLCAKYGLPFLLEKKTEEPVPVNPEPMTPRGVPLLTNFFKKVPPGPSPSLAPAQDLMAKYPEMKKRVPLITLPRLNVEELRPTVEIANIPSDIRKIETRPGDFSAPTAVKTPTELASSASATVSPSAATPKVKKRITPITLSRTPSTPQDHHPAPVHQDTPRPLHTFFKTFQKD